ncbi:MAG: hypothetical protein GYA20_11895 [Chloroflexi bacterium]|nr:hypothetical protein [Chloroflexota bacterium]
MTNFVSLRKLVDELLTRADETRAYLNLETGEVFSFNEDEVSAMESGPINTGKNASLALSSSGRGFIAYIQDEEYSPNLRIALQSLATYIPIVQR